ncbi:MAG: type III pantothenate kinase, partial [Armatimonadota bacterium]
MEPDAGGALMNWYLYADIGNSSLHWGIFAAGQWAATSRVSSGDTLASECVESLSVMMKQAGVTQVDCAGGLMCSSAPAVSETVREALKAHHDIALPEMDDTHRVLVPTHYYDPAQVGADRIANAAAAAKLFNGPVVVIDVGSCLTAEIISDGGELLGGAIAPGLPIMREGITSRTPHLAEFLEDLPDGFDLTEPGRSTAANLQIGLLAALVGTAEILARELTASLDDPVVVLAGGDAPLVTKHSDVADEA